MSAWSIYLEMEVSRTAQIIPIYDAWVTWGSGGLDLEAVGVINQAPEPLSLWMLLCGGLALLRRGR